MRPAAALILAALPAHAEPLPSTATFGMDRVEIRASSEGNIAEVYYYNMDPPSTNSGYRMLQFTREDGVTVIVEVHVTTVPHTNFERITVTPQTAGVSADPSGPVEVDDGTEITIQLLWAMF